MLKELITRFLSVKKTYLPLGLILLTVFGFNSLKGSDAKSDAENFIKINMQDVPNCINSYWAELYTSSNQWLENCGPSPNCICGLSGYTAGYYNVKIDNSNCYSWQTIYHPGYGITEVIFYRTDEFDCYK